MAIGDLFFHHVNHSDVRMGAMALQIIGVSIVYSNVCSGADKKTSKLRVTGLCEGNSPLTVEFPSQRARSGNVENVFIRWRHHVSNNHKVDELSPNMLTPLSMGLMCMLIDNARGYILND